MDSYSEIAGGNGFSYNILPAANSMFYFILKKILKNNDQTLKQVYEKKQINKNNTSSLWLLHQIFYSVKDFMNL